jgi:cyclophilin family peptidyl-prolyl cis-trans isomerase/HEAT repeat protein
MPPLHRAAPAPTAPSAHHPTPPARAVCTGAALLAALLAAACASPPTTVAELDAGDRAQLERMLVEEDQRPAPGDATELRAGLTSDTALLRRFAARGLGRLENPAALPDLAPLLADPDPTVRAQAAIAISQSVFNEPSDVAYELLRDRLAEEEDPATRGALARAIGRLRPTDAAAADDTLAALIDLTRDAPVETLMPTLRGLEWLVRTNGSDLELPGPATDRLRELTRYGRRGAEGWVEPAAGEQPDDEATLQAARVRRLATATLRAGRALDATTVETALYDPDVEVRRIAAAGTGSVADADAMPLLVQIALADTSGRVRYEGLRIYAMRLRTQSGCEPIVAALNDDDPHVALQAIDLLGQGCRGVTTRTVTDPQPEGMLDELARATPGLPDEAAVRAAGGAPVDAAVSDAAPPVAWHQGAHALVSLARLDATLASPLLPAFALHPTWQVRMYTARAAALTGALDMLRRLADDPHPNVREAALRGLADQPGFDAAATAVAALGSDDYQLLITAADTLEGADDDDALPALLAALARITTQQRQTSRDPRLALLERIGELGGAAHAEEVRSYLSDFDPRVAAQAADVLATWTGERPTPTPRPLTPLPFPSFDELLALDGAVARVHMQGGGVFAMELYPFEAPTNVARFARQAREGWFDGLTFHRVVPNFVIQGGSPGANEYVGDGPYTRDEVTVRSHLRGTVGISTRGRDTGDGQVFVNLVDNIRLDHNFTIIGTVTSGMDVIDGVLEGAVIERIEIEPAVAH